MTEKDCEYEHSWTPWKRTEAEEGEGWEREVTRLVYRECSVCHKFQDRHERD